jgi:hypothetical protein
MPPTIGAAMGFITSDPTPVSHRIGSRLARTAWSGRHIGWWQDLHMRDHKGTVVIFRRDAQNLMVSRPALSGIPGRPGMAGVPGHPSLAGETRPARESWGLVSAHAFLMNQLIPLASPNAPALIRSAGERAQTRSRALSYVDAPFGKSFFERSCSTVGCNHMSGLCARLLWPLALMISAD